MKAKTKTELLDEMQERLSNMHAAASVSRPISAATLREDLSHLITLVSEYRSGHAEKTDDSKPNHATTPPAHQPKAEDKKK